MENEKTVWRITSFTCGLVWIIIQLIYKTDGMNSVSDMSAAMILRIYNAGTVMVSFILFFFPLQFYLCAVSNFILGVLNILSGGNLQGIIMYLLGIAFVLRAGFFKKSGGIKTVLFLFVFAGAVLSQLRFGIQLFVRTCTVVLFLSMAFSVFLLLFRSPDLQKGTSKKFYFEDDKISVPDGTTKPVVLRVSREDEEIVYQVIDGKLYKEIAAEYGKSESTIKAHMSYMLKKISVRSKQDLLSLYNEGKLIIVEI
jgi:DNA-binding CsgD family transcriptional regulator